MRIKTVLAAGLTTAIIAAAIGLVAVGKSGPVAAQALPGGTWGPAVPVSLTALPSGGANFEGGYFQSVSCASPGNCAAIGTYDVYSTAAGGYFYYPFVLSESAGTWGTPAAVPGITSTVPNQADAATVSCAAPDNCAATWSDSDGHAYLIDESKGTWGQAQPVTMGTAGTWLKSISCRAAGDCTAVGHYVDSAVGSDLPFVMDSSAGIWGAPQEVPGVAALSSPSPLGAQLTAVSCMSAGNCVAGGYYIISTGYMGHQQPILAIETDGSWGQAQPVAGMTTLNPLDRADLSSVSCSAPGDCAATGVYADTASTYYTWVADESGGTWGPAQQLSPPVAAIRMTPGPVSCTAQGYCAIAGTYIPASGTTKRAFVAAYVGGAWTARDVPGLATASLSEGSSISCGAQGYCTAAGDYYPPGAGEPKEFIVDDVNGTWASAQDVPGMPAGTPGTFGLSCTTPGYCTAVGVDGGTAFTISEANAATITLQPSTPTVTYGDEEAEKLTATATSPAGGGGTPTGTVTVTYSSAYPTLTACRITLANGTGSCALPATALPVGTDQLTATYSGDASYTGASSTATVTVARATTTSVLSISPATVTYGTNYEIVASVAVSPQFTGTPTGVPIVYVNGTAACWTDLTDGKATCILGQEQAGRYQITASYSGDVNFTASNAAAQYLTVTREKTSTTLALSKATITYGHETVETLSVAVTSPVPSDATGKVTVKAGGTSVCVITLQRGTTKSSGSCTLKASQLRPGTYYLKASYPGDSDNAPSTSSSKTLKVLS